MRTSTKFRTNLERKLKLLTRGICSEEEVTNQLIDDILLSDELVRNNAIDPDRMAEFVAVVPPPVLDKLKCLLMTCWRTDEEWEAVRVPLIGEGPSKSLAILMRKNVEALQCHFNLTR